MGVARDGTKRRDLEAAVAGASRPGLSAQLLVVLPPLSTIGEADPQHHVDALQARRGGVR